MEPTHEGCFTAARPYPMCGRAGAGAGGAVGRRGETSGLVRRPLPWSGSAIRRTTVGRSFRTGRVAVISHSQWMMSAARAELTLEVVG
jgi:hypothetical protein